MKEKYIDHIAKHDLKFYLECYASNLNSQIQYFSHVHAYGINADVSDETFTFRVHEEHNAIV